MSAKRGIRAGMAAGALALAVACGAPAMAQEKLGDKPIKIGVLTDFTGPVSGFVGKGSLTSVQFAVADFLASHPNRKVEIVSGDTRAKPDVAAGIARQWFDQDGVDAIVNLPTSAEALAVMQIAKERNKLTLISSASSSLITGEQCNGLTVQWPWSSRVMVDVPLKELIHDGKDSFFFVSLDNASGAAYTNDGMQTIAEAGGKTLGGVKHPFNAGDMSPFMLQAQRSGAKVIVLANIGPDMINGIKAASDFSITPAQTLVGIGVSLEVMHSVGPKVAQGTLFADGWYWDLDDRTRAYASRFQAAMQKPPNNVMAADYSVVHHYLQAADAADTKDAPTVIAQMGKMPVNDIYTQGGQLRPDGQMVHEYYLFQVKTPEESKSEWDLLRLLRRVPGSEAFQPISKSKCPLVNRS